MIISHKIALDPTVEQRIALAKACGCARTAYNWALDEYNKQYKNGMKPDFNDLKVKFNGIKHTLYPWMKESPKDANQRPFFNLRKAFLNFFNGSTKYPTPKKKGKHDSFYISNDRFSLTKDTVRISVIGTIRITEPLRFEGIIVSGVISCQAGRWFIAIQVRIAEHDKKRESSGKVGIDLGIKTALTLSNGKRYEAPKPLKSNLKKLQRSCRQYSRKQKGSNNRKKASHRLARLHARIAHVRNDWIHKITTQICRENQTIVLEDLNVKGMMKNRRLSRAIGDVSFYEIRRQFEYKAPMYGSKVLFVSRWFPSSKLCSRCNVKKDHLALSERTFKCEHCGLEIDRDLNAAINIRTAGLAGIHACGPEGSDVKTINDVKPCRVEAGTRPEARLNVLTN